jgi:hypothetical protein
MGSRKADFRTEVNRNEKAGVAAGLVFSMKRDQC